MIKKTLPGGSALLATGVVLALLGLLLLLSPIAVGNAVVKLVALVLVVTGLVQMFQALRAASPTQRAVSGVPGVIVAGVGVLVWFNPEVGSGFLTALLMIFFVVNGLWKISSALRFRPASGWAWLLLAGLVSLVFVYLLWNQWPLSGAWAIGVLVGLDLLLTGLALILLARALRKARSPDRLDTISL
jgi:uncharacterized membrane protein HdeD (DUF308 family)